MRRCLGLFKTTLRGRWEQTYDHCANIIIETIRWRFFHNPDTLWA
ncbi:hypothetical protein GCWU000325_00816 [Alloprevotella tannerae ATCC 51259]|uniref:Uncharacterized protein n=1 Tax=Alloprevotella tannerae ATCC 51259 TaxID=626522 RepID=C9LF35_9BACT|nr:hypothetical protein GCWU000325_00816 [Alloprevotella tannerae ATCC 51259]